MVSSLQVCRLRHTAAVVAGRSFELTEEIGMLVTVYVTFGEVAPRPRGNAFVPCRSRDLERIFSLQFERNVNGGNTVSFQPNRYPCCGSGSKCSGTSRMQQQVEQCRGSQITGERAKLILYEAFVDGELEAPRSLLPNVHRLYFEPEYPVSPRTMWSLSNALTNAFKKLDPIPTLKRRPS